MRSFVALCLAFAVSSWAYQVTEPNASQGWTNVGEQPVTWDRVSTDPSNFTIVLTNEDRTILPLDQVLAASVVAAEGAGNTSVRPPSGGWPTGKGFRVNFVKSEDEVNTIFAQSNEFEIAESSSSSSSATTFSAATGTLPRTTMVATTPATSASGASGTTGDEPATTSNAAASTGVQNGFAVALFALFATFMA